MKIIRSKVLTPVTPLRFSLLYSAAHKAECAASESLVMSETSAHVVIADVREGDRTHASSVVKVPTGEGQARFWAVA